MCRSQIDVLTKIIIKFTRSVLFCFTLMSETFVLNAAVRREMLLRFDVILRV